MRPVAVAAAFTVLALYGGLILSLVWFLDGPTVVFTLGSARTRYAVLLSLGAATLATCLTMLLALPAAYALSRYAFVGRAAADAVLEFPIIVSPAALGAILLIFFSNPIGAWVQERTVHFVFSVAGVVLAQFVTVLGVAVRFLKSAFDEVPMEQEIVARTLGASPVHVFFSITLPLARRGLIAAFVLAWAKAMGEFGATMMVAGTMAMRTETLPVAIFLRLEMADIEGTVALILVLVGIGLGALVVARRTVRLHDA